MVRLSQKSWKKVSPISQEGERPLIPIHVPSAKRNQQNVNYNFLDCLVPFKLIMNRSCNLAAYTQKTKAYNLKPTKKKNVMQYKVFSLLSFIDFRSWIPTFYCRLFQATHKDKLGISEWVQRTNERTITTEAAILISDIETQKKEHKEKATHHHYCRSSRKNQPLSPIKRKQSKSIAS